MNNILDDYATWTQRAAEFTRELLSAKKPLGEVTANSAIAPRLPQKELEKLKHEVSRPLPKELCRFWLEGSRSCSCRYVIERSVAFYEENQTLYSGASFFEATELPSHLQCCLEWAEIVGDDPSQMTYWRDAVPFAELANGDYLGILMTGDENRSPVVYLSHDDECKVIATSFPAFLNTWENLCYIGPEIWMIEEYLDADGLLDADTPQAQELRDLFDTDKPLPAPKAIESLDPGMLQERRLSFMKQINMCAFMFISDEGGKLPNADNWQEQLQIYNPSLKRITNFPGIPASVCTMNSQLSGVEESKIVDPEKTVLFFESRIEGDNPCGTQTDVIDSEQRSGQVIFALVDGREFILDRDAQRELKWTAE